MIQNYLKAGYPALCVLTQEPHRAEQLLMCDHWQFVIWDCIQGIRKAGTTQVIDEIKDPVEAINWLSMYKDTALIANNLHLFLDIPEVIQAIQTGLLRWKGIGDGGRSCRNCFTLFLICAGCTYRRFPDPESGANSLEDA